MSRYGEDGVGLPGFYPILDRELLERRGVSLEHFASWLRDAGVAMLQYRDKAASPQNILRTAATLEGVFAGGASRLILNDRADLAQMAGWNGVHVGQEDLAVEDARAVLGVGRTIGVSTHTEEQVRAAAESSADYVAIGPVFRTGTKLDAQAVVGVEGVRRARALTDKPLVAIGGISLANARAVIEAGADSVAVISGLFVEGQMVERVARDFLEIFR